MFVWFKNVVCLVLFGVGLVLFADEVKICHHLLAQVAKAWEVLGDPQQRSLYDAQRCPAAPPSDVPRPRRAGHESGQGADPEAEDGNGLIAKTSWFV